MAPSPSSGRAYEWTTGPLTNVQPTTGPSSTTRPPSESPSTSSTRGRDSITSPVRRKPVGTSAVPAKPSAFPRPQGSISTTRSASAGVAIRRKSPPTHVVVGAPSQRAPPPSQLNNIPPPNIFSPDIPQSPGRTPFHQLPQDQARAVLSTLDNPIRASLYRPHVRSISTPRSPVTIAVRPHHQIQRSETMPGRAPGPGPIIVPPSDYAGNNGLPTPSQNGMSKFGAFFGWKGKNPNSPVNDTPTTTISDRSSPAQSPNGTSLTSFPPSGKMLPSSPSAIDTNRANMPSAALFSGNSVVQAPPTPAMQFQIEEMEEELRDITTELASSIRREMELEEQVERLQTEGPNALDKDKRTSDYFSDSGASSNRDAEAPTVRVDDMERLKRRSEQEKAEMKLDLSRKLQEERGRRRRLEDHVRSLEEHIHNIEQGRAPSGQVVELERRLSQEKKHKENVQDMVKALREDLENHKNERDNLRDEVVPSLRARVEGLEAEATQHQKLQYENTRMQQELQALKGGRISSIAEEDGVNGRPRGLSRSGSLLRSGGLARSNSTKTLESRDALAERVKDTEAQRDALHQALKNLLERQRLETKSHEKQIRALLVDRDAALDAQSPRRRGFDQEVGELRAEIDHLRRRADDALAQKWQCEKGLGGLKKDLDRAEYETASLRKLLQANDVIVPEGNSSLATTHATSKTLEKAYQALTSARTQAEALRNTPAFSAAERDVLSRQLTASGQRVEVLSSQVKRQLSQNSDLRSRLAHAVSKGEEQQVESTSRISELQTRLRGLEEQLASAQQASEDSVQAHEDDVRDMRLNEDRRLLRLKTSLSNLSSPRTSHMPLSPFSPSAPRTPRLDHTSTGPGIGMAEVHRTENLESRVRELEKALREAEGEMGEVVQRMNLAQMEVLELQTARDDAQKMTRALQNQLEAESAGMGSLAKSLAR